jgi:hypothetical protein
VAYLSHVACGAGKSLSDFPVERTGDGAGQQVGSHDVDRSATPPTSPDSGLSAPNRPRPEMTTDDSKLGNADLVIANISP